MLPSSGCWSDTGPTALLLLLNTAWWLDQLMNFNMAIIFVGVLHCEHLLFWFSAKYLSPCGPQGDVFCHDNRLEIVWTVIPSIVLAVIIALWSAHVE